MPGLSERRLLTALFCTAAFFSPPLGAQTPGTQTLGTPGQAELPVKRIALFSSGVGYFEHSGTVTGNGEIALSFDVESVNDALKSLVINDPGQGSGGNQESPSVSYPSEDTLERTLQSLGIDLSRHPGTAEIFAGQRGAEIEAAAPNPIRGRILGVETRQTVNGQGASVPESYLSLHTEGGIRIIALRDIASFTFTDPALNADLKRALDLIAANRTTRNRSLLVRLPGSGGRGVSLAYVVSVPVWKVSYRLDLGGQGQAKPLFQGWAIVDNNSDTDWTAVELSLVSGRPVSFIQELYPPYYVDRPTEPLAIAGTARAQSHAGGYGRNKEEEYYARHYSDDVMELSKDYEMSAEKSVRSSPAAAAPRPAAPVNAAASGSAAGDQFAYTVKNPVTLPRRQSAMIPLVSGGIGAVKTLVLSGNDALRGPVHPRLAVELSNTTGMKLPAGPVTVFDGGAYAGDALLEFFGDGDKRLISYGEDLSVTAQAAPGAGSRLVSAAAVSGGVMTISRRQIHERTYTIKSAAAGSRRLIVEHPFTGNAVLVEPKEFLEKTGTAYRFAMNLPGPGEITFKVEEESPLSERIVLGQLRPESLLAYSTNQEIPSRVRTALARAVELRKKADAARQTQTELESRRQRLLSEQDRVRQNLAAVGNASDLGKEYMRRMTALDGDIDSLNGDIERAAALTQSSQKELDDYIAGLTL